MNKRFKMIVMFILVIAMAAPGFTSVQAATAKLNAGKKTIYAGTVNNTFRLKLSNVSDTSSVKWSSSNAKVAKVDKTGLVTAVKKGKANITAAVNGKKYTCKITVKVPSLKASSVSLKKGDKYTVKVNGAKAVSYKSDNKKIAAVTSKGKVTAKAAGETVITVTCDNGKTYTLTVTVESGMTEKDETSVVPETGDKTSDVQAEVPFAEKEGFADKCNTPICIYDEKTGTWDYKDFYFHSPTLDGYGCDCLGYYYNYVKDLKISDMPAPDGYEYRYIDIGITAYPAGSTVALGAPASSPMFTDYYSESFDNAVRLEIPALGTMRYYFEIVKDGIVYDKCFAETSEIVDGTGTDEDGYTYIDIHYSTVILMPKDYDGLVVGLVSSAKNNVEDYTKEAEAVKHIHELLTGMFRLQ